MRVKNWVCTWMRVCVYVCSYVCTIVALYFFCLFVYFFSRAIKGKPVFTIAAAVVVVFYNRSLFNVFICSCPFFFCLSNIFFRFLLYFQYLRFNLKCWIVINSREFIFLFFVFNKKSNEIFITCVCVFVWFFHATVERNVNWIWNEWKIKLIIKIIININK